MRNPVLLAATFAFSGMLNFAYWAIQRSPEKTDSTRPSTVLMPGQPEALPTSRAREQSVAVAPRNSPAPVLPATDVVQSSVVALERSAADTPDRTPSSTVVDGGSESRFSKDTASAATESASFMGNEPGVRPTANPSAGFSAGSLPSTAKIPLAFQDLPPEVTSANPQLAAAVEKLQQDFVNAVGGPNQDPTDPAYYQRWTAAQKRIDEQYRLLVGNQAFLVEQMTVNNQ